ncbi:MAG: four helix bundle protein [Ignavibacteria bacterium]|jgi:four helix bundle protein
MSKIEKFEDLICWQKARILVKEIYTLSRCFKNDFSLMDQIKRASVSVMSNISEGFALRTHKEFKKFLYISHGSLAEVQSILYVAFDLNYITTDTFNEFYNKCNEISKIISGLIKSLN